MHTIELLTAIIAGTVFLSIWLLRRVDRRIAALQAATNALRVERGQPPNPTMAGAVTTSEPDHLKALEERTAKGRLLLVPPVRVYEELRSRAASAHTRMPFTGIEDERALLSRTEPLVALALAAFGEDQNVVAEVWERANNGGCFDEPARLAIRLAALSNETVGGPLPERLIGRDALHQLFTDGIESEVQAVLTNARIDDAILVALYEHGEPFRSLPDDRWRRLVMLSGSNRRLNIQGDTDDSPDLGHLRIHKALLRLLEVAPPDPIWLRILYGLFDHLDSGQTRSPERGWLSSVLTRWADVSGTNYKGEVKSGYYTDLSFTEEFLCLLASIYGRVNGGDIYVGSDPSDPPSRCAHYANSHLSASDIERFRGTYGRETALFYFSIVYNTQVLLNQKLRRLVEDVCGGRNFAIRYRRRCEQLHRHYPSFDPAPTADWLLDD